MLARAGLRDHALFAHAARKQHLAYRVIDLVRASMGKVFPFQKNRCAPRMRAQSLCVIQRRGPATVLAMKMLEFVPEARVTTRARKLPGQLIKRRDERFRHVAAAESAPMAVLIRLAAADD